MFISFELDSFIKKFVFSKNTMSDLKFSKDFENAVKLTKFGYCIYFDLFSFALTKSVK